MPVSTRARVLEVLKEAAEGSTKLGTGRLDAKAVARRLGVSNGTARRHLEALADEHSRVGRFGGKTINHTVYGWDTDDQIKARNQESTIKTKIANRLGMDQDDVRIRHSFVGPRQDKVEVNLLDLCAELGIDPQDF